jgi:hypothetical protein
MEATPDTNNAVAFGTPKPKVQATKKNGQSNTTSCVSPAPSINNINLNEEEKARGRKHDATLAAQERHRELQSLAADAKDLAKHINAARKMYLTIQSSVATFKSEITEIRPLAERVLAGFRYLKSGESIDGYTTATEWAKGTLGISYEWLRRCLKPAEVEADTEVPQIKTGKLDKFLEAGAPEGGDKDSGTKIPPSTDTAPPAHGKVTSKVIELPAPEAQISVAASAGNDPNAGVLIPEPVHPEDLRPTVPESLNETKPSFGIGISPANAVANGVEVNARLVMNFIKSFRKFISNGEYSDLVNKIITDLTLEGLDVNQAAEKGRGSARSTGSANQRRSYSRTAAKLGNDTPSGAAGIEAPGLQLT